MTDRDRLIELIVQANELCSNKDCAECEYLNNDRILCDTYNIADYLLANGVIVPPCKVGQKVWLINNPTLDLINRLQAKNEKLREDNETLRTVIAKSFVIRAEGKSPLTLLKAEAYKEFAEKLHEELRMYGVKDKFNKSVFLNVVDKAKKELVGEDNGN